MKFSLLSKPTELQLEKDASSKYLPVVIAAMVFLASLALIGLFSINSAISDWSGAISGNLTVEIAYDKNGDMDQRAEEAVAFLKPCRGSMRFAPSPKLKPQSCWSHFWDAPTSLRIFPFRG